MIEGKTKSGFKYTVDDRITNDWRFIRALAMANDKNNGDRALRGVLDVVFLVLGEDGEGRLCNHLADDTGFVDQSLITREVLEIIQKIGEERKNS